MSIIRSNIARQLLAEGGAPRSPGNTTLQRVLPRMDGQRPGFYGSDAGFGDDDYKDESASFDAGSGSGGSDAQFEATAKACFCIPQCLFSRLVDKVRMLYRLRYTLYTSYMY